MYTALVIGAMVLTVVSLAIGICLAFDADLGPRKREWTPERPNIEPHPFIDWQAGGKLGDGS